MLVEETNFTTTSSARVQTRIHPGTRARLSFAGANRRANQVIKYNQHQIEFDSEAHGWALCGPRQLFRKISRLEGVAKNLTPDDPRHALLAQIKYYSRLDRKAYKRWPAGAPTSRQGTRVFLETEEARYGPRLAVALDCQRNR